jgi:hypothetical protein
MQCCVDGGAGAVVGVLPPWGACPCRVRAVGARPVVVGALAIVRPHSQLGVGVRVGAEAFEAAREPGQRFGVDGHALSNRSSRAANSSRIRPMTCGETDSRLAKAPLDSPPLTAISLTNHGAVCFVRSRRRCRCAVDSFTMLVHGLQEAHGPNVRKPCPSGL